jgi:hypothetical protein
VAAWTSRAGNAGRALQLHGPARVDQGENDRLQVEHLALLREGGGSPGRLATRLGRRSAFVCAQVVAERVAHRQALDDEGVFCFREKVQLVKHLLAGQ